MVDLLRHAVLVTLPAIHLDELGEVLVVGDANPSRCSPELLNGVPGFSVNSELPVAVGQDVGAQFGNAGGLQELDGPPRLRRDISSDKPRVRSIGVDLRLRLGQHLEVALDDGIAPGVLGDQLPARVLDHPAIGACILATCHLHIIHSTRISNNLTRIELMKSL